MFQVAWCLYIDIVCLDYDGNLTDVCVMAMVAALADLRLPHIIYDEETESTRMDCEESCRLQLKVT